MIHWSLAAGQILGHTLHEHTHVTDHVVRSECNTPGSTNSQTLPVKTPPLTHFLKHWRKHPHKYTIWPEAARSDAWTSCYNWRPLPVQERTLSQKGALKSFCVA